MIALRCLIIAGLICCVSAFRGYCTGESDAQGGNNTENQQQPKSIEDDLKAENDALLKAMYDDFVLEQEKLNHQRQQEGLSRESVPTYEEWLDLKVANREPSMDRDKDYLRENQKEDVKENAKDYNKDTR